MFTIAAGGGRPRGATLPSASPFVRAIQTPEP